MALIMRLAIPASGRAALLPALLLSGCLAAPRMEPAAVSLPSPPSAQAEAVAGNVGLSIEPVPQNWWALFNDPLLVELEAASADNLDLREAAERIGESRAQVGLARSALLPTLSASGGYSRAAISENSPLHQLGAPTDGFDTWSVGLGASWEIDLWGYNRRLNEAARSGLEAAAYGREAVRVSVSAEIARTYLLLRGVQAQTAITQDNRRIAADLLRMAESRERNGVASRFDTAAARSDLAGIDARLLQLGHQRDALMNALALLLARPPRELNEKLENGALPPMPSGLPIGVSSELARNRPDIRQAEARLRAAVANVGAAKADFYPRISLGGSLGLAGFRLSELGSWASREYALGPTFHLPIFEGGRLRSNLALSDSRQRLAAIDYQRTVLQAWHEVDDALGAYETEHKREAQLRIALAQSETALEVAQNGYREGSVDFTSVLVARRTLLANQAALADSATSSALSVVAVYRALGGGWSPELMAGSSPADAAS